MMSATSTLAVSHASSVFQLAKKLDDNRVTPGVLGFIVFALIGGAVWLLMKSMNKEMKKVDFDEGEKPEAGAASASSPGARKDGRKDGRAA
jgi:hypothetical protein